jgi:hypothetical protein
MQTLSFPTPGGGKMFDLPLPGTCGDAANEISQYASLLMGSVAGWFIYQLFATLRRLLKLLRHPDCERREFAASAVLLLAALLVLGVSASSSSKPVQTVKECADLILNGGGNSPLPVKWKP